MGGFGEVDLARAGRARSGRGAEFDDVAEGPLLKRVARRGASKLDTCDGGRRALTLVPSIRRVGVLGFFVLLRCTPPRSMRILTSVLLLARH